MEKYIHSWMPNVVLLLNSFELSIKTRLYVYDLVANYVEQEELHKQYINQTVGSPDFEVLTEKLQYTRQQHKILQRYLLKSLASDHVNYNSSQQTPIHLPIDYFKGFKFLLIDVTFQDQNNEIYLATYKAVYVQIDQTTDFIYTTNIQLIN